MSALLGPGQLCYWSCSAIESLRGLVSAFASASPRRAMMVVMYRYGSAMPGLSDEDLCDIVKRNFDFRPGCIQRDLELKKPQVFEYYGGDVVRPAFRFSSKSWLPMVILVVTI